MTTTRKTDIEGWFASHAATFSEADVGGVRVERLVWKRPESSYYRVDYACIGGTVLCVSGDLGEAVYNTGATSLAWWANCDLSYFASKCFASETGRGFKEWDDAVARARFDAAVAEEREQHGEIDEYAVTAGRDAIDDRQGAWDVWMREHASELFGQDWWDFVPNFGIGPALRCESHLIGLKMALAAVSSPRTLTDGPLNDQEAT